MKVEMILFEDKEAVKLELSKEEWDNLWTLAYNVVSNSVGESAAEWEKKGFAPWPSGLDHPGDVGRDETIELLKTIIHAGSRSHECARNRQDALQSHGQ